MDRGLFVVSSKVEEVQYMPWYDYGTIGGVDEAEAATGEVDIRYPQKRRDTRCDSANHTLYGRGGGGGGGAGACGALSGDSHTAQPCLLRQALMRVTMSLTA
jgi:hypothetical protein